MSIDRQTTKERRPVMKKNNVLTRITSLLMAAALAVSVICTVPLPAQAASASVWYKVHVEDIGWMNPVCNSATAGTEGRSKAILPARDAELRRYRSSLQVRSPTVMTSSIERMFRTWVGCHGFLMEQHPAPPAVHFAWKRSRSSWYRKPAAQMQL